MAGLGTLRRERCQGRHGPLLLSICPPSSGQPAHLSACLLQSTGALCKGGQRGTSGASREQASLPGRVFFTAGTRPQFLRGHTASLPDSTSLMLGGLGPCPELQRKRVAQVTGAWKASLWIGCRQQILTAGDSTAHEFSPPHPGVFLLPFPS